MENFNHRLHLWRMEGAETPARVRDRVLTAVREIAAENDGKTVAVFSHGCAIRLLLAALQGYTLENLGSTPHGDNTAVSLIEAEGDDLRVVFRDDNSHLRDPDYTAGETVRHQANGLEPGLYFEPLRLPEQREFFEDCVRSIRRAAGETEPFDASRALKDADTRPALVGFLGETPVGIVQFAPGDPAEGWISLTGIQEPYRKRGYGVQLIGQAVAHYRPLGGNVLRVALRPDAAARRFFAEYGFVPAGEGKDGREILQKDIGYRPEILNG